VGCGGRHLVNAFHPIPRLGFQLFISLHTQIYIHIMVALRKAVAQQPMTLVRRNAVAGQYEGALEMPPSFLGNKGEIETTCKKQVSSSQLSLCSFLL
jgi:hypothetical protein